MKLFAAITLFLILFLNSSYLNSQNALNFDGINDKLDCGNYTDIQINGNQITLEAWIKPSSFGPNVWSNNIINKETWVPQAGYMLRCGAGGKLNFNLGSINWNELSSSTNVLTLNVWQHVAGTYDGTYMRIYVNGVIVDSSAVSISISNANANLAIGDFTGGGRNFDGLIDEVRIWNIARTKAEINSTMNNEICGGNNDLVAYYRLNSGVASGNNYTIVSAVNHASQTNSASLMNFTLSGSTSNWVAGKNLASAPIASNDTIYDDFCDGTTYLFAGQNIDSSGIYNSTFISSNGCDSIVTLYLTENPVYSSIVRDTICSGEIYNFGSQLITNQGTYNENFGTVMGCDSIITLILYVRPNVDTSVNVLNQTTLVALTDSAYYQWADCDNNFAIIPNENGQSFTPSQTGTYALIITKNHCTDTSNCIPITISGINDFEANNIFVLKPNPVRNFLEIESKIKSNFEIDIYDINSKSLFNKKYNSGNINIDLSELNKGIYFIKIRTDYGIINRKIIKI